MSYPRILPDTVRRIVVARAVAGTYDPHETHAKAIDGARAAARRSLGSARLTHREAVEVDDLVLEARARAQRGEFPAFPTEAASSYVVVKPQQAQQAPSRDTSLILAAIAGLYKVLVTMLAVMTRRSPATLEMGTLDAPLLPPGPTTQPSYALAPRSSASIARPS